MKEGIFYNKDGSLNALVGKDAVHLMRVQTIISGLRMNIATGGRMMITRGFGPKRLLAVASEYTGRTYKMSEKQLAMDHLKVWFDEMKAALPQETVE